MGTQIIAKDVDAEDSATEYLSPVRRGLEAIHFMNRSPAKASRNYAPGKPNGVFVGVPLNVDDQSIRLKSMQAYIQSAVVESASMTVFSVVKSEDQQTSDATSSMFYSTYQSPPADGAGGVTFGVSLLGSGSMQGIAGRGTSLSNHVPGGLGLTVADKSRWALWVHRVGVGSEQRTILRNESLGTQGQNPDVSLPRYPSRGTFRIGSSYTQFGGHCDMAYLQMHSVELSTAEIAAVVADIRLHMARRGLVV